VLGINLLFDDPVFFDKCFSITEHLLDLIFGKASRVIRDLDGLLFASSLLDSCDCEDAVLVDFESDFNLWDSSLSRWDASEIELSKVMIVLHQGAFTFKDTDCDLSLLVLVSRVSLGLSSWENGSTRDDVVHDTSNSLNAER